MTNPDAQVTPVLVYRPACPSTSVGCNGTVHDFVMLHALKDTRAALAATEQGGEFLRTALWEM